MVDGVVDFCGGSDSGDKCLDVGSNLIKIEGINYDSYYDGNDF